MISTKLEIYWEDTIEKCAEAVVGCWVEDCADFADPPELSSEQRAALMHQVEVALYGQRTEFHIERVLGDRQR